MLIISSDPSHPSHNLFEVVQTAASAHPDSIWSSAGWSPELLCKHAKRLQFDGFMVPVPNLDKGSEEARFCVYVHQIGTYSAGQPEQA